jgi:hypothetical protein
MTVALPPGDPANAVAEILTERGRVECAVVSDKEVRVTTRRHTPAWAFIGLLPLLLVRKERRAIVSVAREADGVVLTVSGSIDTLALSRLRATRSPAFAPDLDVGRLDEGVG